MKKDDVVRILNLEPLAIEGGYFRQVFKDELEIPKSVLPSTFKADTYTASTSIYYLLGSDDKSSMHAVSADETWHFYRAGDESVFVELITVSENGVGKIIKLGQKFECGELCQYTIKKGTMMGAKVVYRQGVDKDRCWALLGATVAPSFEYADFVKGDPKKLAALCPNLAKRIEFLG